jgi:hypothetical protein
MRRKKGENSNCNSGREKGRRTWGGAVRDSVDRVERVEEAFEPVRVRREEGEDMMRTRGRRTRRKVDLVDKEESRLEWEYERLSKSGL